MIATTISRTFRVSLLVTSFAVTRALGAQGLSYDMSTAGTRPDRTGAVSTQNYMVAHGQFASGNSRIDYTQSIAPGGMIEVPESWLRRK